MDNRKIVFGITKLAAVGGIIGGVIYLAQKTILHEKDYRQRYQTYYNTTNQWLLNKNDGKDVGEYFKENNYKTIAIYGMGTMAELFYEEVKKADVKVAYFIDKNSEELYYGLDDISVIGLSDISSQEKVDAIIVTPIYDFDKIEEDLNDKGAECDIVSLEDVIYEI